jgi:hypothetical protein
MRGNTIDEPYEYPITPGTEEWASISSHTEKAEQLQIPQDVLEHMTTEALVETVVNYPYLPDMGAFSTQELGYRSVRDGFNGLQELESRPDGMACLRTYYEAEQANLSSVARWLVEIILDQNEA